MLAAKLELELLAIRTLCAGKEAGLALLNHLNPQHFHKPTTSLMYRRLMARLRSEGHVPAWNDLLNDPTIPEEKRQNAQRIVKRKGLKPVVSQRKGEALFGSLDRYRKLRAYFEALNKGGNSIRQPSADVDAIIKNTKSELIAIDVDHRGVPVTVDGVKAKHVKEALTNVDARIETGFSEFDERSGGIPQGAVFLLGADSGQFKSVMAVQLCKNIAEGKRTIGKFSLEMPQPEVTQRLTANTLEINISDEIARWQWKRRKAKSLKEQESIDREYFTWADDVAARYQEASKDWSQFLHITCPSDSVDINWVLQQAEMSDREIIFIDWLGLLDGLSGDDQWKAMSNAARQCKIWTNRTGKTVILFTQMRFEEGKIDLKYSRAVKDHVNNMWGWTVLEVNGRTYLCVHQAKARGSKPFPFLLRVYPEFNKITNLRDAMDEEVARLALEDMKAGKDPAKRYLKEINKNEESGRRNIEVEEDEPLLQNGGFAGRVKAYDTSADDDNGRRKRKADRGYSDETEDTNHRDRKRSGDEFGRRAKERVTASAIREQANSRTRVIALAKLAKGSASLTIEEAAIQADEVIKRWEEASANHRIGVDQLAKEILGLSQTKEILNAVKRIQGDKAAQRRLSKQELEVHKARVEVIKEATQAIKTKGREYVSEDDFYEKDDLLLSVERGEEPIADPRTLDFAWQTNAVAWANQPAITLPNSAKPADKRWGVGGDPDSVREFSNAKKRFAKSGVVPRGGRAELWPPRRGQIADYHYLDDVQLDTAVSIATKYVSKGLADVDLDMLATDIGQYAEIMGPGVSRLHNRRRKRFVYSEAAAQAACKKFGLSL